MIFQDPTTSLNPCFTVGFQLAETLKLHLGLDKKAAHSAVLSNCWSRSASPAPESRLERLPAPALRWHEPARDDRHGDCLQPQAADCRRAHHGTWM